MQTTTLQTTTTQKTLLYKILTVAGLCLALLVMLSSVKDIIYERSSTKEKVEQDISESWSGPQTITGPILVIPYLKKEYTTIRYKYFLPDILNIKSDITREERHRGIYKVPVYLSKTHMGGQFDLSELEENQEIKWQDPYIVLGVSDIRGIKRSVEVQLNGEPYALKPGTKTNNIPQGLHVPFSVDTLKNKILNFELKLDLNGLKTFSVLPVGKYTKVDFSSPWPNPSFQGRYLPKSYDVSENGFTATWETSYFATNMKQLFEDCFTASSCQKFHDNAFGVTLHQGVDVYAQVNRSTKYAILFIGLTFVVFFLFEVLKDLRIHAIQYGLVGVALVLFYLLLMSLSEHIAFVWAYLIASLACIGLLSFYVTFVLKSIARGLVFGSMISGLYGALYLLIQAEDYALLLGAGFLFAVLAFIMVLTRHVDWAQMGQKADAVKERGVVS